MSCHVFQVPIFKSVNRDVLKSLALHTRDICPIGGTEPGSLFDQRLKYRLQIESRATDNLEHISRGRMTLKRLAQLVEQPRILDGDHGLSGEVLNQFDLLVREWTNLLAINCNLSEQFSLFESSPVELEITFSTSEVAVCCSSDSMRSVVRWRSSFSSRVFSMAMTACAAKF